MLNFEKTNRIAAWIVFGIAFVGYAASVSPTVSYWDCGEFAATSYTMGVPHPPGSPLFLLAGRIFSMFPFISQIGYALGLALTNYDIAYRINLISTLTSAFTILFLYLTLVRMILQWKSKPEDTVGTVKVVLSAAIGALTFAFTYSHWFNAVESEVYASSIFFTAISVWLIMLWLEKPDDIHSDVYLLLIAYMIGLSIGVHLLNVLAIPFILFIIYSKKFEVTASSFVKFALIGIVAIGIIYKVYIFYSLKIPQFFSQYDLGGASVFVFFGILIYFSYYFIKANNHTASLLVIATLLIFIGYSTYATVMIRSGMNPNIDQNDPDTWKSFIGYLNRDQYGDFGQYPRVAPFWEYQIKKMFVRYFDWQFVGRPDEKALSLIDGLRNAIGWKVDTFPGTQTDRYGYMADVFPWRGLYGIPFLIGLFGAVHHFGKDWKRALATLGLFICTGIAVVIYLNQPDPQPRERDYSYAGAFFAYSVWIGIGVFSIFETIEKKLKNNRLAVYAAGAVMVLILPVNMYMYNVHANSRQDNYVAWDFSYNLLETCEPNAILYTNGDNDTFPLWYLQEVEHVRPDIRVVNLSLLNTEWYINQLKNHETEYHMEDGRIVKGMKVPITLSDREILGDPNIPNSAIQPIRWASSEFSLAVPKEVYWKDWAESGNPLPAAYDTMPVPKMKFKVDPTIQGQGIRVQDRLVLNMIYAAKWQRPIYFALTVSDDNKVGLSKYLRMDGLAWKVISVPDQEMSMNHMYKNIFQKYKYRNMNNPGVAYDDNIYRLTQNYRTLFLRMAEYYRLRKSTGTDKLASSRDKEAFPQLLTADQKIIAILDSVEKIIPESVIPIRDHRLKLAIGQFYADAGKPDKLREYAAEVLANEKRYRLDSRAKVSIAGLYLYVLKDAETAISLLQPVVEADPNNAEALGWYLQALEEKKDYTKEIKILEEWISRHPQDTNAETKLKELKLKVK